MFFTKKNFHASFVIMVHMHCIVLYLSCSFAVISLIIFIVPCLHFIERQNIFSSCVSSTQFKKKKKKKKNLVCVFLFIPTPFIFPQNYFSQNLFCFSYFYRGRNCFLTFVVLRGSCCSSQGKLSLFLLLCCVCFLSTF